MPDKVIVYSSQNYVKQYIAPIIEAVYPDSIFTEARCDAETAPLAKGCIAAVLFVNDDCNAKVVQTFKEVGVKFIAMRCAGFDRVDLKAVKEAGIRICRVPTYSPTSVAEMAIALMLALNRKIPQTHARVREGNYTLSGLTGFEMRGKTVAVLGTGAIGYYAVLILQGLGCNIVAYDPYPNPKLQEMGIPYVSLDEAISQAHIITLHVPLLKDTHHIINKERIAKMKKGVLIINVSRGGLVDTDAVLEGLRSGKIGGLAMDVYEHEDNLFFTDYTELPMEERMKFWDDKFTLLKNYPNVIISPHSAFFTEEALTNIANTTVENLKCMISAGETKNEVVAK